jgi:cadmium resistance transport/sequestration family protein
MSELANTVLAAAVAFASTNIDDIFLLMLFYSQVNAAFRPKHIVIGQYLGFIALVAISTFGYFGTLVIPREWVGFLGLVPIALGIRSLVWPVQEAANDEPATPQTTDRAGRSFLGAFLSPQIYRVTAVTFANGGDNIGIYVPLFARGSVLDLAVTIGVFLLLLAVWCYLGAALAHHPTIAKVLDGYGHRIVPFVLIGLGIFILLESGTLALLGIIPAE